MAGISTKRHGNRKPTGTKRTTRRRLAMTSPAMEMLEDRRMLAITGFDFTGGMLQFDVAGADNITISQLGGDLIVSGNSDYHKLVGQAGDLKGISIAGDNGPTTQQVTIASSFSGLNQGVDIAKIDNLIFSGALSGDDFTLGGSGYFSVYTASPIVADDFSAIFGGSVSIQSNVTAESFTVVGKTYSTPSNVAVTTSGLGGINIQATGGSLNPRGTYEAQGAGGITLAGSSIQTDQLTAGTGGLTVSGGNVWFHGAIDSGSGPVNFDGMNSVVLFKGITAESLSAVGVGNFSSSSTTPVTIQGGDMSIQTTTGGITIQGPLTTDGGDLSLKTDSLAQSVNVRSIDTNGGDFSMQGGSFSNLTGDILNTISADSTVAGDVVIESTNTVGIHGPVTVGSFKSEGSKSFNGSGAFAIEATKGDIRLGTTVSQLTVAGLLETTSLTGDIYLTSPANSQTVTRDLITNGGNIYAAGNDFQTLTGKVIETNGGEVNFSGHTGNIFLQGPIDVGSLVAKGVNSFGYLTTQTLVATGKGVDIATTGGTITFHADIQSEGAVSLAAAPSQTNNIYVRSVQTNNSTFSASGRDFNNQNGDTISTQGGDIRMDFTNTVQILGNVSTGGGDLCLTADTFNASLAGVNFDTADGNATFNVGTGKIGGTLNTGTGTLNLSLAPVTANTHPVVGQPLFRVAEGNIVFNEGSIVAVDPYKLAVAEGNMFDLVRATSGQVLDLGSEGKTLQIISVGLDKAGNDVEFSIPVGGLGPDGLTAGERLQVIAGTPVEGFAKDITAFGPGNYRIVRDQAGTLGVEEQEDDFILLYRDCLLIMRRPVDLVSSVEVVGADGSDDTFTIDLSGGNPIVDGDVHFDGLGGTDEVFLINGSPETTIYDYTDATSGTIEILGVSPDYGADEGLFTYTNVEQINDENTSDHLVFYFTELADDATLENSPLGSQITASTFTNTLFTHPNVSILIDGLGGDDTINIGEESGPTYSLPALDLIIDSADDAVEMNVDFLSDGSFIIEAAATFTAAEDTAFNLDGSANFVLSGDLTAEGTGDRTFIAGSFEITAAAINFNNANLLATQEDGILLVSTVGDITTGNIEASFAEATITLTAAVDANVSSVTTNDGAFNVTGVNLFVDVTGVINTGEGAWNINVSENFEVLASPTEFQDEELHFEGFEDPTWTSGQTDNWQGAQISRVVSGTGGIDSFVGSGHAVFTSGGPYTRFGGYRTDFGLGFTSSLAVYLDPAAFGVNEGFDYSVAVTQQDGNHLRDFIFHVGNVGGQLLVNASNNTDGVFNGFKLTNENGGDNHTISSAGWYTLEQVFRNDGGVLAVDFNLRDSDGDVVYTVTRSNVADDIATVVGGNRYGWMIFNDINGLAVDNTQLTTVEAVPPRTHFGGDITVSAANMILEDGNITASGDVDIDVTGSVTMLDLETTGASAKIDINAGDAITLADLAAVDGTTTILAQNDIMIGAISTDGGVVDIESLAASVTTSSIDTSGAAGGTIEVIAEENITTGDLTSLNANITLDAGGSILSGDGITGGGHYDAFADGDVTVGDVTSLGGDIALTSGGGDVNHGDLDSSGSGGDITILATAGMVTGGNITTNGGDLLIDALGNILVGMIDANGTPATDGTVLIESETGSVTTGSITSFGTIDISAALDINTGDLETVAAGAAISLFGDADAYLGSVTTLGGDLTIEGNTGDDLQNLYFSSDAVVDTGTGDWNISVAGEVVFEVSTLDPEVIHFEGFEDSAWETDSSSDNWQEFGTSLTRAESGDAGIDSATGVAHAEMGNGGGVFTRLGGYSTEFQDGFSASLAVYLDPADFSDGDGFDYTVAANRQDNTHLREFIFHVGKVNGDLLVNASNNTDGQFNAFKLINENSGFKFTVTTAGWYTLEHVFRDDNGVLAVDMNLKDDAGDEVYSITRSNATDFIATVVGGNRYGWIIFNDVDDLPIDDTQLTRSGVSERTHVGGNITIDATTISMVDSNLDASGEVNLNADSVVGLAIDAEGDVTVATTGDIALTDVSGELIGLTAGGKVTTFDITSTGMDSAVIISASANTGTSVNVRNISAAGEVDVEGVSTVITGSIDGEVVSVTSIEDSVVTGGITSFGDVEVLAGVDITTGAIETTSGAELEGLVLLESTGGSIDVQGNILTDSSDVTAQATGDVDVLDVTTNGGNITLIADSDLDDAGTLTYGNLNAGGGDIYVKGADVVTTGSTVINTDGGSFTFVSANGNFIFNKIDTTGTSSDGNVSINAGGFVQGLQSPSITAGSGSLGITAVGDVTTKALSAGSIDIESTGGLIGVTGTIFAANLVSLDASGDVDVTGMITSTGGNVIVEAGDDVTFGGTVSFPNGSLLVGTPGNEVGNFSSLALSGGQSIKVASSGTVTAGTITTHSDGGEVEILAVGDVQTGGITVLEGLNPGTVTINTAGSITTASIWSEGDLTLISSGSGAISSGGQDLTARQGDIVIDTEGAVTTRHLFAQNGAITVGTATEEVASLTAGRLVAGEDISIYADGKVWLSKGSTDGVIAGTGVMIEGASLLVSFANPGVLASITTSAGNISITVDTTTVTGSLNAGGGSVTIIATGEVSSGAVGAGGDIVIDGVTGNITTGGLASGGAIIVETNGVVWIGKGSGHISATSGVTISGNALWATFSKPGASRNITTSEGDISIDVATTVETGSLTAETGSITIEASGDISSGDIVANGNAIDPNPGNISIDATTGDITSGRLASGGTLNVTTSGDIWISKNSSGSSAKSNVTISGNSLLASFNGSLHRSIASEEGAVSIIVTDDVITGSLTAGTTVSVFATNDITTGTVTGPDGIVLDSTSGDITSGALSATGTGGDITIDTVGAVVINGNSSSNGGIFIGLLSTLPSSVVAGNLVATTEVKVQSEGSIEVGTLTGPTGVFTISSDGGLTAGTVTSSGGTVVLIVGGDNGTHDIGNIAGASGVTLFASTATTPLAKTGDITSANGNISLGSREIDSGNITALNGSVTITGEGNTIEFGAVHSGNGLTINGGGADVTAISLKSDSADITVSEVEALKINGTTWANNGTVRFGGLVGFGGVPLGSVETTGAVTSGKYILNAESYTFGGSLSNTNGNGSSIELYVDAALIGGSPFDELLTVSGTWTLAAGTVVNVDVDGTIANPGTDLPLAIASANDIIDQGATVNTDSVDDYFAEFDDLNEEELVLFDGP